MIYFRTGGMILMILTIVFVILLHIAVLEPNYIDTGIFIDRVFELSVLVIMKILLSLQYIFTSMLHRVMIKVQFMKLLMNLC